LIYLERATQKPTNPRRRASIQADTLQQIPHALARLPAIRKTVDQESIGNLGAGRAPRIEAAIGILEDHLHARAQPTTRRRRQIIERASVEENAAACWRQ
jgi:hypothetical protein